MTAHAPRPANATLILLASLYCAQGLPSGLLAHSLPVLLRQHGVEGNEQIKVRIRHGLMVAQLVPHIASYATITCKRCVFRHICALHTVPSIGTFVPK